METKYSKMKESRNVASRGRRAALLGSGLFLMCWPLHGEDRLLKEYIYLGGRLLAVERQTVTVIAQQPEVRKDPILETNFAAEVARHPSAGNRTGFFRPSAVPTVEIMVGINEGEVERDKFAAWQGLNQGGSVDE